MHQRLRHLPRRRFLPVAFATLVGTVAGACANPVFPQDGPPSVGLTSSASGAVVLGTPVTFTVAASVQPNANVALQSIHLDFGDGQSVELGATPGSVSHAYSVVGTFTASVAVTNTEGSTAKTTLVVFVNAAPRPLPSIGLTSNAGNPTSVGTVITFTVTASIPGSPANVFIQGIRLDFGDGQSADLGASPTAGGIVHAYAAAGTYTPSATVTDTNGTQARASLTIVVR